MFAFYARDDPKNVTRIIYENEGDVVFEMLSQNLNTNSLKGIQANETSLTSSVDRIMTFALIFVNGKIKSCSHIFF